MPQSLHFLPCPSGRLLVQQFVPEKSLTEQLLPEHSESATQGVRKIALIVPPFAEELNRSRRMLAMLGRALANSGVTAVLPDLYGTGDSEGSFSDANWSVWQANLVDVCNFIEGEHGKLTHLVTMRLGARLALSLLDTYPLPIYCWQPLVDGRNYLKQFARAQIMAEKLAGNTLSFSAIEQQWTDGKSVELSGYEISAPLGQELLAMTDLEPLVLANSYLHGFETLRDENAVISPGRNKIYTQLTEAGASVDTTAVVGESFWQTTETTVNESLCDATVTAILNRGTN